MNPQLCFSPPVIPLKSELAYKILERGRVRFWLQAEEISPNVTYKFFANNKEMSGADVRYLLKMRPLVCFAVILSPVCSHIKARLSQEGKKKHPYSQSLFSIAWYAVCNSLFLQPNRKGHDVSTGIIEFIMDRFTEENEGTYSCQITDGGGKAQSSLVLIGDGKSSLDWCYEHSPLWHTGYIHMCVCLCMNVCISVKLNIFSVIEVNLAAKCLALLLLWVVVVVFIIKAIIYLLFFINCHSVLIPLCG